MPSGYPRFLHCDRYLCSTLCPYPKALCMLMFRRGFDFPLHLHRSYEFIAVTEGKFKVCIDDVCYTVSAGNCAFIFPHQSHSYIKEGKSSIVMGIFSPDLIPHFHTAVKGKLPENPVFGVNISRLDEKIDNIFQRKALLYYLCGCLIEKTPFIQKGRNSGEEKLLDCIFIAIEKSIQNGGTLSDIAVRLNYEYSYLSKYFRRKTGMSFTEYLNLCRISLACGILRNENCKIADVAMRSGYLTLRSFNYNFIKITGMTPSKYREKIAQEHKNYYALT